MACMSFIFQVFIIVKAHVIFFPVFGINTMCFFFLFLPGIGHFGKVFGIFWRKFQFVQEIQVIIRRYRGGG